MTDAPIQPVFVDRKTAAAKLMISMETFDLWVRQGFVPRAHVQHGQIYRWHWPTLEKKLAGEEIPKLDEPVRRIMPEGPYVRVRRKKGQCAIEASKERRRIERDDTP
ncbi:MULTISPECIES: hypothetical protein [Bosea]|uniref:Uncharacterized protein n=1 Tax=Bosea robiniae TaxID=1036780 RepID=A0ABY0P296_9HYPH|nr:MULTISPECIES: hypothetical protein [Bosea]TQI75317.1 hypothetical protein FHT98_3096 [Bosea sp. AK1]SDG83603.1 hypothetical protein SAMN05421844_105406 [Bosea robiniae]